MTMFRFGTKIRYGSSRGQFGVLTRPRGGRPTAVVVLVHGGFWTWPYNRWLMLRLARSVRKRGWASFNVEYRRLGRFGGGGGFPETFDDVRSAIGLALQSARSAEARFERRVPVAVVGHSAGGHLALWAGREIAGLAGVVSLAGPTDLRSIAENGSEPVRDLVAGAPADERWQLTSPMQRLPLGVPVVCVHGADDTTVSPRNSISFAEAATEAGDDASSTLVAGEVHRDALRSSSKIWATTLDVLTEWCSTDLRD
jgi:acetyl esterase/lipase